MIISQADFERYTAYWLRVVVQEDPQPLNDCFLNPDKSLMTYVAFPADTIGYLVSTVGAVSVQARFVVVNSGLQRESPYFALVLYAADAVGSPVSAYYLSNPQGSQQDPPVELTVSTGTALNAVQVPHYLARTWLSNWAAGGHLNQAAFTTKYGTLQGYNFSIGNFMQTLFDAQPEKDTLDTRELHMGLCLHQYYSAANSQEPTYTFGLVARLQALLDTPGDPGERTRQSGEPFFDMSTPCPPNI